jgi:formate dehydrogenase major subunit
MTDQTFINVTIDGKAYSVPAGKSILETCRTNGLDIPTLCFDPRLPAYGSCLLCVVEMEMNKISKLVLSCTTEAQNGMVIQTRNDRVHKARKNALDMLLSNHFADCRGACYENCPANVDVQGYLALANAGRYLEALELVRQTNPLPLVCGRVCVRYCEANCRRNDIDSPVAVNFVKRYIADLETDRLPAPLPVPSNGHKVAIVGGGPAGLTAGYYLVRKGYAVEIFESHPKLGGMLRYGIPEYRLPGAILDKEINNILANGIVSHLGKKLGKDFSLDDLKKSGFEAIFLAMGASKPKKMRIDHEDTQGVIGGIDFLEQVKRDGAPELSGHVIVVGGGNTAIDAARTAVRCNADKVSLFYRRTREEMPADDVEIEDAIEEGVQLEFLVAPLAVIAENDKVRALRCQRMKLGEPDSSGRRSPIPVEGSEFDVECSTIIAAIGQDCDLDCLDGNQLGVINISKFRTISIDERTFATNLSSVFAGGDIATGPAAAIDAIGAGRKAADVIDGFLRDSVTRSAPMEFLSKRSGFGKLPAEFLQHIPKLERSTMKKEDANVRASNFKEVDLGIDTPTVTMETLRCLTCGCADVFTCKLKQYASEYGAEQQRFSGKVKKYPVDDRNPYITLDPNKCVLCGLCVRTCDVILGVGALGFTYRGFDMLVQPTMGIPLQDTNCIACGNCIDVCPTGAITFNLGMAKPGPWRTVEYPSICSYCGVGCELEYNKVSDSIWYITARQASKYVFGELCKRGRFGHGYINSAERVTKPVIQEGTSRKTVSVEKAVETSILGLKTIADKYGSGALGFLVSPHATNEEIYLVQKLANEGFGSNHVAGLSYLVRDELPCLEKSLGATRSTVPIEDIENADVIIMVNSDPTDENPVLGFRIRRAVRKGVTLASISSTETGLQDAVSLWLNARRGTSTVLLNAVARELIRRGLIDRDYIQQRTEGIEKLTAVLPNMEIALETCGVSLDDAERLIQLFGDCSKNAVVVYNADLDADRSIGDLQAISNLLLLTGRIGKPFNGLLLTRNASNAQGLTDILSNSQHIADFKESATKGKIKGWFILGEDPRSMEELDPWFKKSEFIVVMDFLETQTVKTANVFIPSTPLAESQGTITSMDGKVHTIKPAFSPKPGISGYSALAELFTQCTGKVSPGFASSIDGNGHPNHGQKFATVSGKAHLYAPTITTTSYSSIPPVLGAIERYFLKTKKL